MIDRERNLTSKNTVSCKVVFTLEILHNIYIMPFPGVILPMFLGLGLVLP